MSRASNVRNFLQLGKGVSVRSTTPDHLVLNNSACRNLSSFTAVTAKNLSVVCVKGGRLKVFTLPTESQILSLLP